MRSVKGQEHAPAPPGSGRIALARRRNDHGVGFAISDFDLQTVIAEWQRWKRELSVPTGTKGRRGGSAGEDSGLSAFQPQATVELLRSRAARKGKSDVH